MGIITTAFVKQFSSNLLHLVQQKGSRLRGTVMLKTDVIGEETSMDQLGAQVAIKKLTRNSDTPITQPNLQRRWITMFDYEVAKLHDKQDQLKMLLDPTSQYVQGQAFALGRSMDDSIIAAASADARTDKTGSTSTSLPSASKVVSGSVGLTLAKLLATKEILDGNEVDEEEDKFFLVSAKQMTNLFNTTEIKNSDYNTIKALSEGKINEYLGFKFKRTERLAVDGASARLCLAYARTGIGLAIAQDIVTDIGIRRDKSNAKQVYASLGIGSSRLEEEKVIQVACTES